MGKIFMLSFANIKKSKGHAVSILLLFIIAAMLLNLGLLILVNFGGYFEDIIEELNSSDVYYLMPDNLYSSKIDEYINSNDNIETLQRESAIWVMGTIPYNGSFRDSVFLINNARGTRNISNWKFVGEHLPPDSMSIYVPYVMKVDGGYSLNDEFMMELKDITLNFTIKGFIEDVFFSSLDTVIMGVYLPNDTYETVLERLGDEHNATLIFANLREGNNDLEKGIRDIIREDNPHIAAYGNFNPNNFLSLELEHVKMSRSMMAGGISVMMIAFSTIITVVCLIVVRYRIVNSIEEDMTKIGSLKAVGYTSKQIILSIVTQFSIISLIGSVGGISLSYLATPVLSKVFAHQSGLRWEQGFDGVISAISLFVILSIVALVSLMASWHINKLNPIVALRGGIMTHSFRKNHMPLHKTKGSLPSVLAFKLMLQNMRQSIMISIIFMVVSFASAFAFVMFYNSTIDTTAFAEIPGVEQSHVIAMFNNSADSTSTVENIKNLENVKKAQFIDTTIVKYGNREIVSFVMDDFSEKVTNTVYDGRYPIHSNEIVVSGYLANSIDKRIGGSIVLEVGDRQAEFIITGLSQGAPRGELSIVSIQHQGILRLFPDFQQLDLHIYLDKNIESSEFRDKIENLYGYSFATTIDMYKEFQDGMGQFSSVLSMVGITILVITLFVVILVLYFVINSSVIRKKHELGLQKALGFTTFQLMKQLSLGLLPPIVMGVFIGSMLGMTQTNSIMTITQKTMGIMRANYIITPSWIIILGAIIVLVSYVFSMLITYRIRKITAYSLVNE
ncbi:ABC transporter permease [Alkalicella caledoniensis]|uniref:ABC transporter permease n=1 Tax=Alkalicella caledoniensis TaxID=2731377 RepID=A0A7G9W484_ALKCA|nr:ABC transporter permease [Alkalicella caledoniensis]QNO13496.1 ABC transporter permease [Alkalicella caledoniensis]